MCIRDSVCSQKTLIYVLYAQVLITVHTLSSPFLIRSVFTGNYNPDACIKSKFVDRRVIRTRSNKLEIFQDHIVVVVFVSINKVPLHLWVGGVMVSASVRRTCDQQVVCLTPGCALPGYYLDG